MGRPPEHDVIVDSSPPPTMVPVRDGARLATDVYQPPGRGPWPALVMRTPYGRSQMGPRYGAPLISRTGIAVVVQDVRGTNGSDGDYLGLDGDGADGYDCVEWVAAQSWCTGNVGMFGPSAMGATQWSAAQLSPPHLVAMAPEVIAMDESQRWAFRLHTHLLFALGMARTELVRREQRLPPEDYRARLRAIDDALADPHGVLARLPVTDQPLLADLAPFYFERAVEGPALAPTEIRYETIEAPAFVVAGWFDFTLSGCLEQYRGMRERAATARARDGTSLLVGPYYHGVHGEDPSDRPEGWLDVAGGAAARTVETQPRWMAWMAPYLYGQGASRGTVQIFTGGVGRWQELDAFPPADAVLDRWYLSSAGHANGWDGDGRLDAGDRRSPVAPGAPPSALFDEFTYDPLDPFPSPGGALGGVFDLRPLLDRRDVCVYRSAPLDAPLEATGAASVTLSVSTSASDTDITAMLLDIRPDGVAQAVADNLLRLRYRNGLRADAVQPGRVYAVSVDLVGVSTTFLPGHRIGVAVSSSNFPLWDRNPNTGEPEHASSRIVSARQRILHDEAHPSYLELHTRRDPTDWPQ